MAADAASASETAGAATAAADGGWTGGVAWGVTPATAAEVGIENAGLANCVGAFVLIPHKGAGVGRGD